MCEAVPTNRRSFSPGIRLQHADGPGYHSANGEFNYYPTSAHKRQPWSNLEAGGKISSSSEQQRAQTESSLLKSEGTRAATSPSSAGLSRSPSQPTPAKSLIVVRRSVSQPLSSTPTKPAACIHVSSIAESSRGGAPLLHRYRTSRASLLRRTSQLSVPNASGTVAKQPARIIRRSLLRAPTSTPSETESSSHLEGPAAASSSRVNCSSGDAESGMAQSSLKATVSSRSTSSSRKATFSEEGVPVTRVRLVGRGGSVAADRTSSAAGGQGASKPNADATQTRETRMHASSLTGAEKQPPGNATVTEASRVEAAEPQDRSTNFTLGRVGSALLSKDPSQGPFCSDFHCIHSEKSIGEFILMQRELRRCYSTMEDYEEVVAQLRQECFSARAALHQLQQRCVQHEAEMDAAVREELIGQRSPLRQPPCASEEGTSGAGNEGTQTSNSNDRAADETMAACLETTWHEVLDELRRALQQEKAAHAATRHELHTVRFERNYWRACTAELRQEQRSLRRKWADASPEPYKSAGGHLSTTSVNSARASPSRTSPIAFPDEDCAHHPQSSISSSPAPRFHSPPHPHQVPHNPRVIAADVDGSTTELSVLSALTDASPARMMGIEAGTMNSTGECAANDAAYSRYLSSVAGESAEAVGSGLVVVEGERAEKQDQTPGEQSTLSLSLSGKTADTTTETKARKPCESHVGYQIGRGSTVVSSVETHTVEQAGRSTPLATSKHSNFALLLDRITSSSRRRQQHQQEEQQFAFPPPAVAKARHDGMLRNHACAPHITEQAETANMQSVELKERKCKELLCALMDKERQLSFVAEERTRYRRLYEELSQKAHLGSE